MANGTVSIGKIFGIGIELHWMFILLILFFFYISPLFGLVWVLLFICVLIHELSHSVTSIRNGINVSRIILMPIGGASIIEETKIAPDVEFRISIAGPIMSLFLGGLFGVMVIFTPPGIITFIVQYLFLINILLGVFNILPAFPMDGGRVLRSYLEKRQGAYRATMNTLKVSKYCVALIIIGTVAFLVIPSTYDLAYKEWIVIWNLLIVFFLYQGITAEKANAVLRHETRGMKITDVISRKYAMVSYRMSIGRLYGLVRSRKEHIMVAKKPDGTYALVDIFNRQGAKSARTVADMLIPIPNIGPDLDLVDAIAKIETNPYRVAAVVKGKRLLGIATSSHINAVITLHMAKKPDEDAT